MQFLVPPTKEPPGQTEDYEHTRCPTCNTRLIERYGYRILANRLTPQGTCPQCGTAIAGRWGG